MYKVKFTNIMEMLYSFGSDQILVGVLKKVCCNNAVVSNILMSSLPVFYYSAHLLWWMFIAL